MTEGEKARAWRESLGLSRAALSAMTGYSVSAIRGYEAGKHLSGSGEVAPRDMLTYKLACAAISSGLSFDWGPVTIKL